MARKEKMKVYHGLPKSITDKHTVFYADFDGKLPNLIYEDPKYTSRGFRDCLVGLSSNKTAFYDIGSYPLAQGAFTLEFWISNLKSGSSSDTWGNLISIGTSPDSSYAIDKLVSILNANGGIPNDVTILASGRLIDSTSLRTDNPLFIRFTFDGVDTVKSYINGVYQYTSTVDPTQLAKWRSLNVTTLAINIGHNWQSTRNSCYVSEVHISNIDRGDYFPNLPQDFIDGKAIVVPKMGQQQIKGDPMYSQVTEVKVPFYNKNSEFKPPYSSTTTDGMAYLLTNPEISTNNSEWGTGTNRIKIKGLNGEIISGVIDTDTALAKLTKSATSADTTLYLDDVTKFSVGDTIKLYDLQTNSATSDITLTNVNIEDNSISFAKGTGWTLTVGRHIVVETTTSSSSPVVKTLDGTTVVGTWSGLGTNEATFTLGTNSNILGKDLYVTYALTMPSGNSDFPELPHTIERAWTSEDVEMKPVSEILIVDDFKGKISGSTKECPHTVLYRHGSSLGVPSTFNGEIGQVNIDKISSVDGNCYSNSLNSNRLIPQVLFSFNLIEIVERKLGCKIPSRDKVQWLKDNLDSYTCNCIGYGSNPSGSKYSLNHYCVDESRWYGNPTSNTSNSPSKLSYRQPSNQWLLKSISSEGYIHFIVYTEASDGTTTSTINTDYVSLDITLKVDTTFTTLYCDNSRAREDVCNPVLIQKETKTVKRYIPSKENFATECLYLTSKHRASLSKGEILAIQPRKIVSTCGTGSYVSNDGRGAYKDYLQVLPNFNRKSYEYDNAYVRLQGQPVFANAEAHSVLAPIVKTWGGKIYTHVGNTNDTLDTTGTLVVENDSNSPMYEFFGALKNISGELYLTVQIAESWVGDLPKNSKHLDYKLVNAPLIK